MSLIYLLDTNTISEPTKPSPNLQVIEKLDHFQAQIALPIFVVYELTRGAYQLPESKKRSRILRYVEKTIIELPVLLYTEKSAIWHGKEAARLQGIGKSPPFIDAQIAAVAVTNNLILVTRNTADFKNFADLQLENWFE
ncbi:MAG: type II toxin-antitoxin system VapC family toxin [Methylococcaceae bacterium]